MTVWCPVCGEPMVSKPWPAVVGVYCEVCELAKLLEEKRAREPRRRRLVQRSLASFGGA
jgi:uncharacterized Zn finger protein (UPF0148 family)